MKILDRLPVTREDALTNVGAETVRLKKDQIIVWVSLSLNESFSKSMRRLPAILDTGHNHNL